MTTSYKELGTITPPNMQQYDFEEVGTGGWTGADYVALGKEGAKTVGEAAAEEAAAETLEAGLTGILARMNAIAGPFLPAAGLFIGGSVLVDSVKKSRVKRLIP